jgi:uncharacterized protein
LAQLFKFERLALPGQAGELEALIEVPQRLSPATFAVICHPHPLYGGTLDNKVVYTLARAFQEFGAATIRFNFRGVGASEGGFGDGLGETDDALAAIVYGRNRWPGATLWLGGFSFGGAVAIRAASLANAAQLVTVAPAISRVDVSTAALPDCPWLIVQGDADEVVDPRELVAWVARLTPSPQVTVLAGAGHFFHGRLHELRAAIVEYLSKQKPG